MIIEKDIVESTGSQIYLFNSTIFTSYPRNVIDYHERKFCMLGLTMKCAYKLIKVGRKTLRNRENH